MGFDDSQVTMVATGKGPEEQPPERGRDGTFVQWTVVIPLKPLSRAKSRLADTAHDGLRPGLALAFAQDTVAAALACPAVRDVAVVTNDALAARELAALGAAIVPDDPLGGLNARSGARNGGCTGATARQRRSGPERRSAGAAPPGTGPRPGCRRRIPARFPRGRGRRGHHSADRRAPVRNCCRISAGFPKPPPRHPVPWKSDSPR